MARYIKYSLVDNDTGEFLGKGVMGSTGLRHPFVKGLDVIAMFEDGIFYAKIDDDAVIPTAGAIEEVSISTVTQYLQNQNLANFNSFKQQILEKIWSVASEKRADFVKDYHMAELVAGATYKITEANLVLANSALAATNAPNLVKEANARGIGVVDLANKVITKYNNLTESEATIAGYAGKLADTVNTASYANSAAESIRELKKSIDAVDTQSWLTMNFARID